MGSHSVTCHPAEVTFPPSSSSRSYSPKISKNNFVIQPAWVQKHMEKSRNAVKTEYTMYWELQVNQPSAPSSRMVSPVRRMELPPAFHELCPAGSGRGNVTSSNFLLPLVSTTFTSTTAEHKHRSCFRQALATNRPTHHLKTKQESEVSK